MDTHKFIVLSINCKQPKKVETVAWLSHKEQKSFLMSENRARFHKSSQKALKAEEAIQKKLFKCISITKPSATLALTRVLENATIMLWALVDKLFWCIWKGTRGIAIIFTACLFLPFEIIIIIYLLLLFFCIISSLRFLYGDEHKKLHFEENMQQGRGNCHHNNSICCKTGNFVISLHKIPLAFIVLYIHCRYFVFLYQKLCCESQRMLNGSKTEWKFISPCIEHLQAPIVAKWISSIRSCSVAL